MQVGSKLYAIGGFTSGTGLLPVTRRVPRVRHGHRDVEGARAAARRRRHAPTAASPPTGGTSTSSPASPAHGLRRGTNTLLPLRHRGQHAGRRWSTCRRSASAGLAYIDGNAALLRRRQGRPRDARQRPLGHRPVKPVGRAGSAKAPIPLPGDHMSHAVVNGKHLRHRRRARPPRHRPRPRKRAYIQHNYLLAYNPANDTWTRKADMPLASSHIEGSDARHQRQDRPHRRPAHRRRQEHHRRRPRLRPRHQPWTTLATRYPKRIIGATAGYWNGRIY